jgi:quinoprotein glucose dehydrogenase
MSFMTRHAFWALAVSLAVGTGLHESVARSPKTIHAAVKAENTDWPVTGGSATNIHYSRLKQINTSNVSTLQEVWRFDTKEAGGLETTPLVINGVLYAYTPNQKVIALDGASGKQLWEFTPEKPSRKVQRGLVYWQSENDKRIFANISSYVYALDATTGKVISSFGNNGRIDVRENLRDDAKSVSVGISSPGVIYKDLLILGDAMEESLPAPPGDVRAYDVNTGALRWAFHTIPRPGEFGYETWPKDAWKYSGAANNWTGMAVDTEHGIVYVPTGSAATDWYGADRVGDDLFANSLVALNAETGKRIWHFQAVHHDLWDRDFPAPPTLVTVLRNGKQVPAVAQTTKQGTMFLFNRLNGTPLFPIENRKFPASTVPGEVTSAEQPVPTKPAPFSRQLITENDLTDRTPEAHQWAVKRFHEIRSEGQFIPVSVDKETMMFPGTYGGAEWGGSAFDPATYILYVNADDYGLTESLAKHQEGSLGRSYYMEHCSVCHGADRKGSPPDVPSLIGVESRLTRDQFGDTIQMGRGRMPAFSKLANHGVEMEALRKYLANGEIETPGGGPSPQPADKTTAPKFDFTGYNFFNDPEGYPAVRPPWGTLNAINLNTGEYVWKVPLGEYPALVAKGMKDTGSQNLGGPIVTDGGLLFIGATIADRKFRAYDKATGKLLWETTLPLSANCTPITYEVNGRQYIAICAGGQRDLSRPSGGMYLGFALPQ